MYTVSINVKWEYGYTYVYSELVFVHSRLHKNVVCSQQ